MKKDEPIIGCQLHFRNIINGVFLRGPGFFYKIWSLNYYYQLHIILKRGNLEIGEHFFNY